MADDARQTLILGTAGHIDHGKTSLVRALTGIETDRLPEEKARGITIELGFAPLALPSGRTLGVVDVPGHEGLVRTMVAGASGIDLVLLVVAADEGVMPQTREHLEICRLLGLENAVVALTKIDRADPDVAELAHAEVEELVATTSLAGAPVVPVSSTTGAGVDAVRDALEKAADAAGARTRRRGPARLWVDRAFEMRGFGVVATGTLIGAPLAVGQEAELWPSGRTARIRGLQCFGQVASSVPPGSRCAVNLQGVSLEQLGRGMLITEPDRLEPTASFDAAVDWLDGAPARGNDPSAVELLIGTTQHRARIAPIGADGLRPGARGFARIHLDDGTGAFLPGDGFVLRGFARLEGGGQTLGGGTVLDVAPPHRRRSDPALANELAALADADPDRGLEIRIARAGYGGVPVDSLRRETGQTAADVGASLTRLEQRDRVARVGGRAVGAEALASLEARLSSALGAFHDAEPMRPGMPRSTLRGALPGNVDRGVADRALERLEARGEIETEGEIVRAHDFVPRLTQRHEALAASIRADAMIEGLEPATVHERARALGIEETELRNLLAHLERDGSLVRAPGDFWFDSGAVDELRERVIAALEADGELTTAAYKDLIGTTRKFAVPLMELFDAEHLTMRRGEARVLRRVRG